MLKLINFPFVIVLFVAVLWATLFSFSQNSGIRRYRNLGIVACYLSASAFLFIAGWKQAAFTWICFAVLGGLIYTIWEITQRVRTPGGVEKPSVSPKNIFNGLLVWPIMIPEATENFLTEIGLLKTKTNLDSENPTNEESNN